MNRVFPKYIGGPKHGDQIMQVEPGRTSIRIPVFDDVRPFIEEAAMPDATIPWTEHIYQLQPILTLGDHVLKVWALSTMDRYEIQNIVSVELLAEAGCFHE